MSSVTPFPKTPRLLSAGVVDLPGRFPMRRGGSLDGPRVAYESWGYPNAAQDNIVLLFTGLSPSAHAASHDQDPSPGWWEYMIGAGKPIDTTRWCVICINSLGSCFGSTGPASINPATGQRYGLDFPELTVEDIAAGARVALRGLGIRRVRVAAGASMGGMSALAYALQFPDEVDELVTISATAQASPFAIAMRSMQREMIRRDPDWQGGNYPADRGPHNGMLMARKLGITTYRSPQEWQGRFGRAVVPPERRGKPPFGIEFEIESYLDKKARDFIGTFDANAYLYLSRAMDLFDVAEYGGSVEAGLPRIRVERALVVGVATDFLFALDQQQQLADGLRAGGCDVSFHALDSLQGHDSFLLDEARFAPVVRMFMDR